MDEMFKIQAWEVHFCVGWHDQNCLFFQKMKVPSSATAHSQSHTKFSAQLLITKRKKRAQTKGNNHEQSLLLDD